MKQSMEKMEYPEVDREKLKNAEIIDLDKKRREKQEKEARGEIGQEKVEQTELNSETVREKYEEVFSYRKNLYEKDIQENPTKGVMLSNLETHNEIVLDYAVELTDMEKLSKEDRVAAILATIMHDSGKLSSELLNHHEKGVEYAGEMLEEMKAKGEKFEGIEVTPEIRQKVEQAIERHMNHPFLVSMNKGEKFPVPENNVDKVVFDADMLANIGFKNVAFRLVSENFLKEDAQKAVENNTGILEESFINVMQSVTSMDSVVLSSSAQGLAENRIGDVKRIFEYLKTNEKFKMIQDEFSVAFGNFDIDTVRKSDNVLLIKKLLNEEIAKAAMALNIEGKIVKNLLM